MASHPPHFPAPPRFSDDSSRDYSGAYSYEHHGPPIHQSHQQPPQLHQHYQRHHHYEQHDQSPPSSASLSSPAHANHPHNNYPTHTSQSIGRHYGPGNPGIGVSDLYQSSPVGPSLPPSPNNSIPTLPRMRTIDALPPPLPSGMSHPPSYAGPQNMPPGHRPLYSIPPPFGLHHLPSFSNYRLHPGYMNDPRMPHYNMNGLRHKKDIKRRTKTGCMTCRKRRIKASAVFVQFTFTCLRICRGVRLWPGDPLPTSRAAQTHLHAAAAPCDETHPTCNNCKKSKRDCAGYDPIFKPQLTDVASVQTTAHSSPQNETTPALTARSSSPPPLPSTSFASVMASTRPSLGNITSPHLLKRPLYRFPAPGNSGSAVSSYCSAIFPTSSSRELSEYTPNTAISSRCNGDSSSHQSNDNEHDDRRSSHEGHCKGDTHAAPKLEANNSIYSSHSAVSPQEKEGPLYDVAAHAYKNEPRRDYWADRPRPVYTNSSSESQDFRRYN